MYAHKRSTLLLFLPGLEGGRRCGASIPPGAGHSSRASRPCSHMMSVLGAGAMTELDEPIHLCDYDQQWPLLFPSEVRRIAAGLPGTLRLSILAAPPCPAC